MIGWALFSGSRAAVKEPEAQWNKDRRKQMVPPETDKQDDWVKERLRHSSGYKEAHARGEKEGQFSPFMEAAQGEEKAQEAAASKYANVKGRSRKHGEEQEGDLHVQRE